MVATWSDSESSSSEEKKEKDKIANFYLIGLDEEVTPDTTEITFAELHEAFCDLLKEFQKVVSKNKDLKIKYELGEKEKSEFIKIIDVLKNEKEALQKEVNKLKPIVDKFTISSEKLQMILNNQKGIFDKAGLGFKPNSKQRFLKNFFTPASTSFNHAFCFKCGKIGHKAYACKSRVSNAKSMRKIWVPKGTNVTNCKDPRKLGYLKLLLDLYAGMSCSQQI